MLKIYNTLSRRKEPFLPRVPGKVGMYVCGLTTYDYFHVGNARTLAVFDMVSRWLKCSAHGYQVNYVRNITDVDDKIIQRAADNKEPIEALTARMISAMQEDTRRLGLEDPSHEPRATGHVAGMVSMIEMLIAKGLAYPAANGDVFYAVHKFQGYGKLSGKSLDDLRAGERVGIDSAKRDPLDFVLWKSAKAGEPSWPSPWGAGRPGWHIECSAMSKTFLGRHFDIHGGGEDLQFPHHENEIAQSEGAHDEPFVNYWMHAAFLNMGQEKMSKSLGNVFRARDVLDKHPGHEEAVRFFLLRGHYRSQLGYTEEALQGARKELSSLYIALRDTPPSEIEIDWENPHAARFLAAMDDDFNTWEAFAVLGELRHEVNRSRSKAVSSILKALAGALGFLRQDPLKYLRGQGATLESEAGGEIDGGQEASPALVKTNISDAQIGQLIAARLTARKAKNFGEADRIRDELDSAGVLLEDKPNGVTEWRRK
ncbi:MAG: cysteine--tRNA ligase [Burkholderiales bacterium]|nr:cysteine--tRNA ligase [Burkholderiales bacterium]